MAEDKKEPVLTKTIADLASQPTMEGAHIVKDEDEIPKNNNVVFLNPAHAAKVPISLVNPNDIYYQSNKGLDGKMYQNVSLAINVEGLQQNSTFQQSQEDRDKLFNAINLQMGQPNSTIALTMIKHLAGRGGNNEPTLSFAKKLLRTDYDQTIAIQKTLHATRNYPTTDVTAQTEKLVHEALSKGIS